MSEAIAEVREAVAPLLAELGAKNHVRVAVHRSGGRAWSPGELVHDSRVDAGETVAMLPELVRADSLRALAGKKPVWLEEAIRLTGGELRSVTPNLRTTVGIDYCATQLGGSASTSVAKYIALSNNLDTPLATDTATNVTAGTGITWGNNSASDGAASNSRGELNYAGMARAAAAYAHTPGVASYSQTITFTASGGAGILVTNVQACGLFDQGTRQTGTLFVENIFTPTSLSNNDTLTIAWTLQI